MNILGINCGHNGSAALIQDGVLTAFVARERISRKKNHRGLSRMNILYVLFKAGLKIEDIDFVGINNYVWQAEEDRRSEGFRLTDAEGREWSKDSRSLKPGQGHELGWFEFEGRKIPACYVHHHVAHAASTFYLSNFDEAAVFTVDSSESDSEGHLFTEEPKNPEICSLFARGSGSKIEVLECPGCMVGNFYTEVCEAIGFPPLEGAGKVMGLAPYGEPVYYKSADQGMPGYGLARFWQDCGETPGRLRLSSQCMEPQSRNIAASLQRVLEETLLVYARRLYEGTGLKKLCLAGGTTLNSVANMRILKETPFEEIFIIPAATDDGTAIGCALYAYHDILKSPRSPQATASLMYGGYPYPPAEITRAVTEAAGIRFEQISIEAALLQRTASLLSEGKIIGWFQEGCEIGPRSLGHRSILADPRRHEMKDILNHRVKFRESFRPFAPSILEEFASEYFDLDTPSPFMLLVADCKKPEAIPAALHVDKTGRVQTVNRTDNGIFYGLIKAFHDITGTPVLLNTSFNVKGQPIVETPQQAIECFLKTDMDYLVMGSFIIRKS